MLRMIGFENTTRDGLVYLTEGEMIDAAKAMMIADGKVYSALRPTATMPTGRLARKAARKAARREHRALLADAEAWGIDLQVG